MKFSILSTLIYSEIYQLSTEPIIWQILLQTTLVNEILGFVELLFSWVRQLKAINLNKNCIVHSKMMSTMGKKKNSIRVRKIKVARQGMGSENF